MVQSIFFSLIILTIQETARVIKLNKRLSKKECHILTFYIFSY